MWVIILLKKIAIVFLTIIFVIPFNCYASEISAKSAIVMDADTGIVLYENNAYKELSIASTTKIMTAIIALSSDELDLQVTIKDDMLCEGSSLGLKANDVISLYDLVVGMMLCSGNDAANAIAFTIAGGIEAFANLMNNTASQIGMNSTLFVTPSGLDEGGHHSTAYDMALLARFAISDEEFCNIVSKKSAEIIINGNKQMIYNHNKLLSFDDSFFGIKTGFTEKAGRCLVSAKKYNNARLICVTLNAPNDWNDHQSLMAMCESEYKLNSILNTIEIDSVGGELDSVSCSYKGELYTAGDIQIKLFYYPFLYAPVKAGDIVGYANIYSNDILIERLPIEVDEDLIYAKQE